MAQDGNSDAVSPLSCTNRQLSAEDGTVSYWGPSLPCSDVGDTLSLKSVNVNRRIAQGDGVFTVRLYNCALRMEIDIS